LLAFLIAHVFMPSPLAKRRGLGGAVETRRRRGARPSLNTQSQGKPDPADKEKLIKAAEIFRAIEGKLKDPAQWQQIAEVINKVFIDAFDLRHHCCTIDSL